MWHPGLFYDPEGVIPANAGIPLACHPRERGDPVLTDKSNHTNHAILD